MLFHGGIVFAAARATIARCAMACQFSRADWRMEQANENANARQLGLDLRLMAFKRAPPKPVDPIGRLRRIRSGNTFRRFDRLRPIRFDDFLIMDNPPRLLLGCRVGERLAVRPTRRVIANHIDNHSHQHQRDREP
jgi:hypothetical protein